MAADRISLAASSHLNSSSSTEAQRNHAPRRADMHEPAAAQPLVAASSSARTSSTEVTISQRAKDMAAQRQNSDGRQETQRMQEQQAVQQMSLLNGELRRAYGA